MTRALLILSLLALPLQAQQSVEWRAAAHAGVVTGAGRSFLPGVDVEVRSHHVALAGSEEFFNIGESTRATHVNLRYVATSENTTFWIGAGPTWISTDSNASTNTWNADAGLSFRTKTAWEPFVAARYYAFRMPVFRDVVEAKGPMLYVGIARRIH
jgi:hypothetical protein